MNLNIVMLGPSGVGKTSLLAAMRKTMQQSPVGVEADLFFTATAEVATKLDSKWNELASIKDSELFEPVSSSMEGTMEVEKYAFSIKSINKTLPVNIFDIRGGMVDDESRTRLAELLAKARVIFHVVDAAAMMELPVHLAERANSIGNICELMSLLPKDDEVNVISILTKSETYLKNEKQKKLLESTFRQQFEPLQKILARRKGTTHEAVAVKTLGCVFFSRLGPDDELIFVRNGVDVTPEGCDLPLTLAMHHLYEYAMAHRWFLEKWLDDFRAFINTEENMGELFDKLKKATDSSIRKSRDHVLDVSV